MINRRVLALAVMAVLLAGAVGFTSSTGFDQGTQPTAIPQVQEQGNSDLQAGNQIEDGLPASSGELEGVEASEAADSGPDSQDPGYAASVSISPDQYNGLSESDEAAALQAKAAITPAQAESAALAANPGASVTKTELDNENGALVYSVELSDGADVKVDAGAGAILHTDAGGDNEG